MSDPPSDSSSSPPAPVIPPPAEGSPRRAVLAPMAAGRAEGSLVGQVLRLGDFTYALEAFLGAGGMGEVYRATQTGAADVRQTVAIKVMRGDMVGQKARSFIHEARLHSLLRHRNINHVHGFHQQEGTYYLVMEYLDGQTLWHFLRLLRRKGRRLSAATACYIVAQVASALDHAHQLRDASGKPLKVVHRDVTPSNIFLTRDGEVKLLDFGIALSAAEDREQTSSSFSGIKGKPSYLSPEQVERKPLDGRSDLFALGCVLVELLTGQRAFAGERPYVLDCIQGVEPGAVDRMLPGVHRTLKAICQKALARDPAGRYPSGAELARALRSHGRGHGDGQDLAEVMRAVEVLPTVTISVETSSRRRQHEPSRKKWFLAGVGLVLLALAGAGAFAWYRALRPAASIFPPPPSEREPKQNTPGIPVKTIDGIRGHLTWGDAKVRLYW